MKQSPPFLSSARDCPGDVGHNIDAMPARTPTNNDVAAQFELLADLIELEGGDSFRINAYRRAAKQIQDSSGSVSELALAGRAVGVVRHPQFQQARRGVGNPFDDSQRRGAAAERGEE